MTISILYIFKNYYVNMQKDENVQFIGKVAKFPKNVKAKSAYTFLENIKISNKKLWYVLIEKDQSGLQILKYNNSEGYDLFKFVTELKGYYMNNPLMCEYVEELKIDGEDKFSIIYNIPDVEINGVKFINILTNDLIRLLK